MAETGFYRLMIITIYVIKTMVLAGRFSGTPQDAEVIESADALYTCTVQSLYDNELIKFSKDGVKIEPGIGKWERFEVEPLHTFVVKLRISSVERSDRGSYSCEIRTTNDDLVEKSAEGMLTVLEIPGDNWPSCQSTAASKSSHVEGESVELECISEETNPLPTLNWDIDADVKDSQIRNSTDNGFFSLHYSFITQQSDNGKTFKCLLQTALDTGVNRECFYGPISVQYAPNVTIITQDYYTGKEMVLICNAQANPNPATFSWSFSKALDDTQHKIENNNQILRLHHLNPEHDNLKIECTATNTVGSRSAQFTVIFKDEQTTNYPMENDPVQQDANTSMSNSDATTDGLVVILAIIFICLFFVVLVLAIPICIIKLHKSRMELNQSQRELPPQPSGYYDQFNNFHIGHQHMQNQNTMGYKTMNSSNGSEHSFPVFESHTLPLSHRLPQTNNISQDSWVMTLPVRPHTERKLTRHRSVEIQASEDTCPIYEELGKSRGKARTESKSIMTEPTSNHYGRSDTVLENICEENGITNKLDKVIVAKSPELNPELIVYAKTEFV
ncbi:cell adhesion molecule 2-like isoform X2 [Antedon mediterranea]